MNSTCNINNVIRSFYILVILAFAALMTPSHSEAHAPGVVLSGSGTAVVDGVAYPGEWSLAGCLPIEVNILRGTTPGKVCAMNDNNNLYLSIVFMRSVLDPGNTAVFEFDNNHNGVWPEMGDDILLINPGSGFFDEVRTSAPPCPSGLCGFYDTSVGGTNDGSGAFANDGTFTTYEFSHPLNSSDDSNDFSLSIGDTVGFRLSVRIILARGGTFDTNFPATCTGCPNLSGDIVITSPPLPIDIDIKPRSLSNSINSKSKGKIPLAILSSPTFDAPNEVDATSFTFGRTGNEASLAFCNDTPYDVNGDGLPDIFCHFYTQATGFLLGDTQGVLKGKTLSGATIRGTDSVRIVR